MRQLMVSEWMSLDGVFDGDTMDQWFNPFDSAERQDHIRQMILDSDAFLYGRSTYEMLFPYWSPKNNDEFGIARHLNAAPKYVVSSKMKKADWNNTTIISDNAAGEIAKLKALPGHQILLSGSATLVQSLMDSDLIDLYRFLVQPIVAGSGKRFFKDGMDAQLKLTKSETFDKGVVRLDYEPVGVREAAASR